MSITDLQAWDTFPSHGSQSFPRAAQHFLHLLFCGLTSAHKKDIAVRAQLRCFHMELDMIESSAHQCKTEFPGEKTFLFLHPNQNLLKSIGADSAVMQRWGCGTRLLEVLANFLPIASKQTL